MASRTPSRPPARSGSSRSGSSRAPGARSSSARRSPPVKQPRPWGLIGVSSLVALACIGVLTFAVLNTGAASPTGQAIAREESIEGVRTLEYDAQQHTPDDNTTVQYTETPPAGGAHSPIWQNCAVYDSPIRNENAVHSLEHGAVWVTYRPDLPADQVQRLRDLVSDESFALLSPYPGLPSPVVVSAWGRQLAVDSAADPRVREFVEAFQQSPRTTPEPGAVCSGGRDEPAEAAAPAPAPSG